MSGKEVAYVGHFVVVPEDAVALSSSNSVKNQSFETQVSSKTDYKDYGGGCSAKVTKKFKSGGFVDGRNGNPGYKEEVNYKSSVKVNDKDLSCTTRYETEVKHKKVTTYSNPSKNNGGFLGGKAITCTKPNEGSGGVKYKSVATYGKSSGMSGSRSYGSNKKPSNHPY